MIRVIFAEWRKLRRPTLFLGTLGAALFFTGLTTTFLYLMIDSEQGNSDRGRQVSREVLNLAGGSVYGFASVGGLLGIIALCVFAAQTAQEYTYGTLRNLLVRQPGRVRLLAGKLAAMKIFALLLVAIAAIVSVGLSVALADRAKVSTELWFTSAGYHAIGQTLLNVSISVIYFGIIGMTLGLLLRSPISAISIAVLWILIIENLIGAVKPVTLDWMPGNQLSVIAQGGSPDVSYSHALILGSFYVFIGAMIATVLFSRRDVAN
ncbi:MAG: ABC transporter permease [Actinobacteria bacterium]|nr:ABC transporter permease [Actinomycetota bacterium]